MTGGLGEKDPLKSVTDRMLRSTPSTHGGASRPPDERGCKPGYRRWTIHVKKDTVEKLAAIAYWDRKGIKDVVEEALTRYLKTKKVRRKPEGK